LIEARTTSLSWLWPKSDLAAVRSNGLNDEPQYKIEIDLENQKRLILDCFDVNTTLSAAWYPIHRTSSGSWPRSKKVFIFRQATTANGFQKNS